MARTFNQSVWKRAKHCCEYCRMPQQYDDLPFQIDHILARQHGGPTTSANTGLACMACNKFKGPNIASLDPATRKMVPLFHPRRHKWRRHFRWQGPVLLGRTPIGRATVALLCINLPERVALRALLIHESVFPLD